MWAGERKGEYIPLKCLVIVGDSEEEEQNSWRGCVCAYYFNFCLTFHDFRHITKLF